MRAFGFLALIPLLAGLACGSSSGSAPASSPAGSTSPPPTGGTPPTCSIGSPAAFTSGLSGAVPITASASGAMAIAAVDFRIDGADLGSASQAPYTFTLPDTGAYASGQHVLEARSRDTGGNASAWAQAVVSFGGQVALPAGFSISTLTSGLTNATALEAAPDGRIFIAEQAGTLRIVKAGALLPAPFATLPAVSDGERGLLGVTFDPAFASNGYVYVYYTAGSPAVHNRISRLASDPANPDQMLAGSEVPLVDLPDLVADNHNGGAIHFGPDGKLYAAVGDNNTGSNAPSLGTVLGKILRYDPDGTIPSGNPFAGTASGANLAIWAKGLRNPFSFAFQPGSGRMHINDVGLNTWEEVNLGAPGADYGWPSTEGPTTAAGITGPIFAYGHDGIPAGQPQSTGTFLVGQAILGAAFDPPGSAWPAAYVGSYYFSDLDGGWIARMHLASGTVSVFARGFGSQRGLAFGADGALYVLGQSTLQRIAPP